MTQHSDIHLEEHRTRVVSDIEINAVENDPPIITLDPAGPSLRVGDDDPDSVEAIRVRDASDSKTLGSLTGGGDGVLRMSNKGDDRSITLRPADSVLDKSDLEITYRGSPTVKIEDREGADSTRHRLGLFDKPNGQSPLVEANNLGQLLLDHQEGIDPTCELDGERAALLLPGIPDVNPDRDIDGGGELLLRQFETPATGPRRPDITVHAKAIVESKYGVRNDNRPRVYIDGPEATLELGREETKTGYDPINGAIQLQTDTGHSVLEARVTENHESEFVFKRVVDGTPKHRGEIRSRPNGIAIYDAGGNEALRIMNNGDIKTRKEIITDANL